MCNTYLSGELATNKSFRLLNALSKCYSIMPEVLTPLAFKISNCFFYKTLNFLITSSTTGGIFYKFKKSLSNILRNRHS